MRGIGAESIDARTFKNVFCNLECNRNRFGIDLTLNSLFLFYNEETTKKLIKRASEFLPGYALSLFDNQGTAN